MEQDPSEDLGEVLVAGIRPVGIIGRRDNGAHFVCPSNDGELIDGWHERQAQRLRRRCGRKDSTFEAAGGIFVEYSRDAH